MSLVPIILSNSHCLQRSLAASTKPEFRGDNLASYPAYSAKSSNRAHVDREAKSCGVESQFNTKRSEAFVHSMLHSNSSYLAPLSPDAANEPELLDECATDSAENRVHRLLRNLRAQDLVAREVEVESRNYVCDVCQKAFIKPAHLTRHKLIHSAPRQFKCGHCDKAFYRKDKYKEHVRVHLRKMCTVCNILFEKKSDLHRHLVDTGHRSPPETFTPFDDHPYNIASAADDLSGRGGIPADEFFADSPEHGRSGSGTQSLMQFLSETLATSQQQVDLNNSDVSDIYVNDDPSSSAAHFVCETNSDVGGSVATSASAIASIIPINRRKRKARCPTHVRYAEEDSLSNDGMIASGDSPLLNGECVAEDSDTRLNITGTCSHCIRTQNKVRVLEAKLFVVEQHVQQLRDELAALKDEKCDHSC